MTNIVDRLNKNFLVFLIFFFGSIASIVALFLYFNDKGKETTQTPTATKNEQVEKYNYFLSEADNELRKTPQNYADALVFYKKAFNIGKGNSKINIGSSTDGIKLCEAALKKVKTNDLGSFDRFMDRFISDMDFQLGRIRFPLEEGSGYFSGDGVEEITKDNYHFAKMKLADIPDKFPDLKIETKAYDDFIEEYWYKPESGFSGTYRYRKLGEGWFLVYVRENNF